MAVHFADRESDSLDYVGLGFERNRPDRARPTRFVSFSVMIGFLTGIAANMIFGQIPDLTGASASGGFALAKAIDVGVHPGRIEAASILTGLGALAIMVALARTRLDSFSAIVALGVPTLLTLGIGSITRVDDVGEFRAVSPSPTCPTSPTCSTRAS
jgi:SulP family sulfate permease